jgi:uncharacterized small protein (DUF1192 family)
VRSLQGHLNRKLAAFSAMNLKGEIEPKKLAAFEQKKAELQERIAGLTQELDALKARRKAVQHHITIAELYEAERFTGCSLTWTKREHRHAIDIKRLFVVEAIFS